MKSVEEPSKEKMAEARLRARILAPAVNIALAPILVTATIVALMGEYIIPVAWTFEMWLWISLLFVPGVAVFSIWQARILTRGRPLHERALTGVSAMLGAASNLAAMAATHAVLVIGVTIWFIFTSGEFRYPEIIWQIFLRLVILAFVSFLSLAPYFLISGAVLGLITAAIVHHTYNSKLSTAWRPGRIAVVAVLGTAAAIWGYTLFAQRPTLPLGDAACVPASKSTILKREPGHSNNGIRGASNGSMAAAPGIVVSPGLACPSLGMK